MSKLFDPLMAKINIDTFIEETKVNLKYLPRQLGINLRIVKNDLADKVDKKKEEIKANNAEERKNKKEQKKANNIANQTKTKSLSDTVASHAKRLGNGSNILFYEYISRAEKTQDLINFAYYYMQDSNAKLLTNKNQTQREIINGVADFFEFGKIYKDDAVEMIRKYDPEYQEYDSIYKFLLSMKDLEKKKEDNNFMQKMRVRKEQLGLTKYKSVYDYIDVTEDEAAVIEKDIEKTEINDKRIKAGIVGEQEVEYALKWLSEEYNTVERNEEGIVLKCADLIDEQQEIDHIVLSPKGVFLIETKNLSGTITIDAQGNWIRKKTDGTVVGERNPIQQINRHHRLLEHILGMKDIFDIVCLANIGSIIQGSENSPVQIVKVDMLAHYISEYKSDSGNIYDAAMIEKWKEKIDTYRVKEM